jgi:hypothetical protein
MIGSASGAIPIPVSDFHGIANGGLCGHQDLHPSSGGKFDLSQRFAVERIGHRNDQGAVARTQRYDLVVLGDFFADERRHRRIEGHGRKVNEPLL